jgi:hypothetical protein
VTSKRLDEQVVKDEATATGASHSPDWDEFFQVIRGGRAVQTPSAWPCGRFSYEQGPMVRQAIMNGKASLPPAAVIVTIKVGCRYTDRDVEEFASNFKRPPNEPLHVAPTGDLRPYVTFTQLKSKGTIHLRRLARSGGRCDGPLSLPRNTTVRIRNA